MTSKVLKAAALAAVIVAVPMASASAADMDKPVAARQAVMKLYGFYMGTLGGMAKGKIDYDAKTAAGAAKSLHSLSMLDSSAMWPAGSGRDKLGKVTRAKAEIWSTYPKVAEKSKALTTAAAGLAKVAGNGLDGLRGGIGPVGESCGGCHKPFRHKQE